jgi:hypothetical protein
MRHPIKQGLTACATLFILLIASLAVAADGDVQALAKRLAELRAEVEELSGEVDSKKAGIDAKLRSIRSQKADLEMQIQREETRLAQLRQAVAKHRERIDGQKKTEDDLEPAVLGSIADVRATVENSLPFKRSERLAELDKLDKQLTDGLISPQKATSRLWQFVEDELRLSRENGLYRQIVEVDGEEVLADVARVGMVAIYFKTEDGRFGAARQTDEGWAWHKLSGEHSSEQVRHLFDSFKKNIRVGYFEIPNTLPPASPKSATPKSTGGVQ